MASEFILMAASRYYSVLLGGSLFFLHLRDAAVLFWCARIFEKFLRICVPSASRIATIGHIDRPFTLSIALLITASVTVVAQPSPSPSPSPPTLRAALLAELHSSHDKAEWFTPMNTAVAGLTAEQAKWVPHNSQGK